jgi:flavin reductase (DIM6/NTAB) family NADH-FMN oxidoreductase RutF
MTESLRRRDQRLDATNRTAVMTPDAFKEVFRHHPAGVAVITFRAGGRPVGFTATSVISVSADPPVLAFSVAAGSSAHSLLQRARSVVVNFLAEHQAQLAARFATRGIDRFAGTGWAPLPTGEPMLPGTTSWVRGRISQRVPAGDSLLLVVEALSAARNRGVRPLLYEDRTYRRIGDPVETVPVAGGGMMWT